MEIQMFKSVQDAIDAEVLSNDPSLSVYLGECCCVYTGRWADHQVLLVNNTAAANYGGGWDCWWGLDGKGLHPMNDEPAYKCFEELLETI